MVFLLSAVLCMAPILITPGLLFHYDSVPKIALFLLSVSLILVSPRFLREGVARLWSTGIGRQLCILTIAQIVWTLVATVASRGTAFSILGSGWRRFGLLTIVALGVFGIASASQLVFDRESIRPALRAIAMAAIAASCYAILQYFGIDPLQNGAGYTAQDGDLTIVRPPGPLGHADYLGWWLSIALFCSWGLYRIEDAVWHVVSAIAVALSAAAIVLSGTRSAMVAVAAAMIFLMSTGRLPLNRRRVSVVGLVAVASVVFYLSPAGKLLQARVKWSTDEAPGGARPLLWRDALRMAISRPLTGFGPETFSAQFPRFQSEDLSRLVPDFYHESPHNVALDALTGEGIPGLLISLGWLGLGCAAVFRSNKNDFIGAALAGAFAACVVSALFNSLTIGPAIVSVWVVSALIARTAAAHTNRTIALPRAHLILFRSLSMPLAAVLTGFAVYLVYSDYKLERFKRVSDEHNLTEAVRLYQDLRTVVPQGAGDDLYCSRRLATLCGEGTTPIARLQCSQVATQAAARATRTADSPPNAWYNLAMFAAANNDPRGAQHALQLAVDLAPEWYRPHWALSNYLRLTGHPREARMELERAAWLSAGRSSQVSDSVRSIAQAH